MRTVATLVVASLLASGALAAPPTGWPNGATPKVPANFRITAYARGLDGPRALLVLPNGDVLVAESRGGAPETRPSADRVTLLRDSTHDGVADQQFPLIDGLVRPYGLALRRDRIFIGDTDAVVACPFLVGQTRLHGDCHELVTLPNAAGRDHWMRALAFNADETQLYVGVGAFDDPAPGSLQDPLRAAVLAVQPDGKGLRVFARGLHAPAALAIEPQSGRLFATVDNHSAPDFLTRLDDKALYGEAGAARVAGTRTPDLSLGAGAMPQGLAFYQRDHFPRDYRGGAFVALAGQAGAGPRVAYLHVSNGAVSGAPEDFVTGFQPDGAPAALGRPVALAVGTDGALLIADDVGNTIWRVTFKCAACTPDPVLPPRSARR
jgi:glucose/arabinose dehydrogenase